MNRWHATLSAQGGTKPGWLKPPLRPPLRPLNALAVLPLSMLLLLVSAVLASITVNPSQVTVDVVSTLRVTMPTLDPCVQPNLAFLRLNLTGAAITDGAFLSPVQATGLKSFQTHAGVTPDALAANKAANRSISLAYYSPAKLPLNMEFKFFDPKVNTGRRLTAEVFCGLIATAPEPYVQLVSGLLPPQPLVVSAVVPNLIDEKVAVTPSPIRRNEVANLTLAATWPFKCSKAHRPTIKLSLNPETIEAGGALSSNNITGYLVYGEKKGHTYPIISAKSNASVVSDGYDSVMFLRQEDYPRQSFDLSFKMLAQNVSDMQVQDTPINVEFLCNDDLLKGYTKALNNAPILKVSGAISASALSVLACLASLLVACQ